MPRRNYPKKSQNKPARGPINPILSCKSKRRFPTEKIALDEIETKALTDPNVELYSYQCGNCGGWHLSSIK